MKNKKLLIVAAGVLILAVGIGVGAYAASAYGTQSDPLVAKSYLDDVFTPQLQAEFDTKVDTEIQKLEQQISSVEASVTGNFQAVTLTSGQTLTAKAGCEIILRSGSAAVSGSVGLSDITSGSALANGNALTANHLCVVAGDDSGVKATSAVTMLVSGVYSIA